MPAAMLSERPAWAALRAHHAAIRDVHLRRLFAGDPRGGARLPARAGALRPPWAALGAHRAAIRDVHMRQLFADDPRRGERLTADAAGLHLDYSKNRLTDETLRLLVALAEECGVRERAEAMFRGERINTTENRPVLHVALRAPRGERILVDGKDVVPEVHAVLGRMGTFARRV